MADFSKLHDLCDVLGLDLLEQIHKDVDESVTDIDSWMKSDLTTETAHRLTSCVDGLSKIKRDRFIEIKKLALPIMSYWNALMVPFDKKQEIIRLIYYEQLESDNEITTSSGLSLDFLNKVVQEHHVLREQVNELIVKKKSKLMQILTSTHLPSSFFNKDISDPMEALLDMKASISKAQDIAAQRAAIVAKMEFIQHSVQEIDWYSESKRSGATLENERSTQAKILQKGFPTVLKNLKVELGKRAEPFIYDERDALNILEDIEDKEEKTLDTAGTSTGVEDMEVEHAHVLPQQQPLQPDPAPAEVLPPAPAEVLPLQPLQPDPTAEVLPQQLLQPAKLLPLFPLPANFGVIPRARRTQREPAPPSPPSPESSDSDYDPTQDQSDSDE